MKEKMKGLWHIITGVGGLVIGGLVIMAFLGVFDDEAEEILNGEDISQTAEIKESGEGTVADGNDVAANQNNTDIDAVLPGDPDYKKYIHVGDKCKLVNGGTMEILDAGYGFGTVYVLVEFTSGDVEALQFDQSDATLYIDDYEVPVGVAEQLAMENGYIFITGDTSYPTQASANAGGRKASMVFVADISDDISETAEIKFDITGAIFKINPLTTGQARENTETDIEAGKKKFDEMVAAQFEESDRYNNQNPIVYGSYSYYSEDGNLKNMAYVEAATDKAGEDHIFIDYYSDPSGQPSDTIVSRSLDKMGDCYVAEFDYEGGVVDLQLKFADGGMYVDMMGYSDCDFYEYNFTGFYHFAGETSDRTMTSASSAASDSIPSGIVYGTYSLTPNVIGGYNVAEVGFYTDENGGDYVSIMFFDENGEFTNDYNGYSAEGGNPCIIRNKYGTEYQVTFVDGGMNIETVTGTVDDYDEEFIGFYQLDELLNFDEVS